MGPAPLHGRAAVVEGWKHFYEGPAPFSWAPERVEVTSSGTLAISSGPVFDPDGQPCVDLHLDLAPRQGRRVAGGARHRLPTLPVNEHVRVCRDCGEEYRPGIVRCADCGGELEDRYPGDEPPPKPAPDAAPEAELAGYRVLFTTARATDLVPMASGCARRRSSIGSRSSRAPRKDAPPRYAILVREGAAKAALAAVTDLVAPHEDAADVHAVETRFDPERGYLQCPACGTAPPPGATRVPRVRAGPGRRGGGRRAARVSVPPGTSGAVLAERARQLALETGFDLAGVARADSPPDLSFFGEWVARGHAGEMAYLSGQVAKRSDLRVAFPWARSVLCVGPAVRHPARLLDARRRQAAAGSRATRGATTTTT